MLWAVQGGVEGLTESPQLLNAVWKGEGRD